MSKFYTEEMKKYIADNSEGKLIKDFYKEFNEKFNTNITHQAMRSYLSTHKLKVGRGNNKKYRKEHIAFIKENVKNITLKELTKKFNKKFNMNTTEDAIANLKVKYGLHSGIVGGQFQKGCISFNKGKKWDDYMSKEAQERARRTTFKKGNIPSNRREIGEERVDIDGYTYIKIQDGYRNNNWILKHRYIYENVYGKIPDGYMLMFADKDKTNFDINNLILVSNEEELIMNNNNLIKEDKELTKTGLNIAKVLSKVNKRGKKQ